jgi:hypothetical protein
MDIVVKELSLRASIERADHICSIVISEILEAFRLGDDEFLGDLPNGINFFQVDVLEALDLLDKEAFRLCDIVNEVHTRKESYD